MTKMKGFAKVSNELKWCNTKTTNELLIEAKELHAIFISIINNL